MKKLLNKIPNLPYIKIWRIFLLLFAISILTTIAYEETKTTVSYVYNPNSNNNLITKRHSSPNDSPIVEYEKHPVVLLNQSKTRFDVILTDIFEEITIKAYYRSPNPEQVSIRAGGEYSIPIINTEKINLLNKLEQEKWPPSPSTISPKTTLYEKPGLPKNFPPIEKFSNQVVTDLLLKRGNVFVVKNDQNIEHRPIYSEYNLSEIAYLIVPDLNQIPYVEITNQTFNQPQIAQLQEIPDENQRRRGAAYQFILQLEDFDEGDWAALEKVEVHAERNPVQLSNVVNRIKQLLN